MKRLPPPKPDEVSIFIPSVTERTRLRDYRLVQRYGDMAFGSIKQVARNYGIKLKKTEKGLICTATKSRLQMFAEKLHFSLIDFQ